MMTGQYDPSYEVHLTKAELDYIANLMNEDVRFKGLAAIKQETLSLVQKFSIAIQTTQNARAPNGNSS